MGTKNNQPTGIETEDGAKSGAGAGNAASGSTDTKPTSSRGAGRGRGAGAGASETEKGSSVISLVETKPLDEKEAAKRAKRAEQQRLRRLKNKEDKEKKTGAADVQPKTKADATQIKMMLQAGSLMISTREGLEEWALSEKEIDQIAQPLANILSKYEGMKTISLEYADHLALLVAAVTILFPRVLATLQKRKQKLPKEVKVNARSDQHKQPSNESRQQANGTSETSRGSDSGKSSPATANVSTVLLDLLPATASL